VNILSYVGRLGRVCFQTLAAAAAADGVMRRIQRSIYDDEQ